MNYVLTPARKKTVHAFAKEYRDWKREYYLIDSTKKAQRLDLIRGKTNEISRPTEKLAIRKIELQKKIDLIEETAFEADPFISRFILRGVTEGRPFEKLTADGMPYSRNTYYDRRRKFFFLLSEKMTHLGV